MFVVDQNRVLLRGTGIVDNVDLRSGHRACDARFDLLESFHNQLLTRQDLPDFHETFGVGLLNPLNPVNPV